MDAYEHSPEALAALELYHQLCNLSADKTHALLVTLRMPNGRYVGDVWLSLRDVQDLADASVGLATVRDHEDAEQPQPHATAPAMAPLPPVDADDVTDVLTGFEKLLGGEQQ